MTESKPPEAPFSKHARSYPVHWAALVLLLLIALLLWWVSAKRMSDFRDSQELIAAAAVVSLANEVGLSVSTLRRQVRLFASERAALLQRLLVDREDEQSYTTIARQLDQHFPDRFAFSLANDHGVLQIDDFDGRVGDVCARDVKAFASKPADYEVFVHPNAEHYHFDIPVLFNTPEAKTAVFMVSFRLDPLTRLIRSSQLLGYDLMLVRATDPSLIEVTAKGGRNSLDGKTRLSAEELSRAGPSQAVDGTAWTVRVLYPVGLFDEQLWGLVRDAVVLFILFFVAVAVLTGWLARAERHRRSAERQLQERNQALARSLHEQQRLQEQLVESGKLASLGGLVAGVAHEINTPVGSAMTAASTVEERVGALVGKVDDGSLTRSELQGFLDLVREASAAVGTNLRRAGVIIRSFKQVAVDQASETPRRFDFCEYMDEILVGLRPRLKQLPHRVEVDCPGKLVLFSYPGAIAQVITNLAMNSIKHGFKDDQPGMINILVESSSDGLVVHYRDDGAGIPAEHRGRVFEPFFTTARGEGGTGLGMSIVHNLVARTLRGRIQLLETDVAGVCFRIELPDLADALVAE